MEQEFDFDGVDFVTADTHFGHARITEYARRPFVSVEDMDRELVRRWNATVAPNDVVLHLGDFALGPVEESLAVTALLHGRKFLVPGNHDRVSSATQSKAAIARFTPLYVAAGWTILPEVVHGTRLAHRLLASHYPYSAGEVTNARRARMQPSDEGLPLLHGHTHARDHGPHGRQFHVGVDATEFAPLPFTEIDRWLEGLID